LCCGRNAKVFDRYSKKSVTQKTQQKRKNYISDSCQKRKFKTQR
jgi:hypothetical protein